MQVTHALSKSFKDKSNLKIAKNVSPVVFQVFNISPQTAIYEMFAAGYIQEMNNFQQGSIYLSNHNMFDTYAIFNWHYLPYGIHVGYGISFNMLNTVINGISYIHLSAKDRIILHSKERT